jgi:hypothetical protein
MCAERMRLRITLQDKASSVMVEQMRTTACFDTINRAPTWWGDQACLH